MLSPYTRLYWLARMAAEPYLVSVAWRELKYCKFSFWEANSSKDTSSPPLPPTQHFIKCPWQFAGTHLYSWMEIGTASVASFLNAIVVQYKKRDVISS